MPGVPIDVELLGRFCRSWDGILSNLIADVDRFYGVYDGTTFKVDLFEQFLVQHNIPWPRLKSGQLELKDDTFRDMARCYPVIGNLQQLRAARSQLRKIGLTVGSDGRNRASLFPFAANTGRNQPSNAAFIFGMSAWFRGLIKPPPGYGVAYIDWISQEVGIAAALSGDQRMMSDYQTGDPYLALAKLAKAAPLDATKATHKPVRDRFKACVLGTLYGLGRHGLAVQINQPPAYAHELQQIHRRMYPRFWDWTEASVDAAMLTGSISTVFGWRQRVVDKANGDPVNHRALLNFPAQANAADMLRIACCLGTERGVEIVAPIHDAVLVCAPVDRLDDDIATMREAMREASVAVLRGFELQTEIEFTARYPDRYRDKRGVEMWRKAIQHLDRAEKTAVLA